MYPSCSSTSAYVSDLPVRLTNKFRPLPNYDFSNAIPEGSIRFPAIAISDEYDFATEKKALQDFESHMRSLAELQRQYQQLPASINSTLTANTESSSCSRSTTVEMPPFVESSESSSTNSFISATLKQGTSDNNGTASSSILLPNSSSCILQPTPASVHDQAMRTYLADRKMAQTRMALSLEDFENVQSSPFDALELKTINDVEELRRISTQQQPFNPSQSNGFLL